LKDISQGIYKGSSTGNDSIFIVELIQQNNKLSIVQSKKLKEKFKIENNILKPFLYGKGIKRYFTNHNNYYLVFPYIDGKLISEDNFKINFPYAYKYLLNFKNKLLERKNKFSGGDFYKFSAARNLSKFKHTRILVPDILVENRISIDLKGEFLHGPAIHSLVLKREYNISPKFLLALMNSKIFWFFIKNTSTALRGDAYRLVPEYLNPFPLPFLNKKDEKLIVYQKKSELIVDQIMELHKKYHKTKLDSERNLYKKQIDILDNQIDQLVYELYGLTEEEIKIVEGGE
jgi:adenine-specific DNA-methyltransferase